MVNYMIDFERILVSGSTLNEFSKSLTKAIQALPPNLSDSLREIRRACFAQYGFEGTFKRMNDHTVDQIFAEFQHVAVEPIASGKLDGVEYRLYKRPPTTEAEAE